MAHNLVYNRQIGTLRLKNDKTLPALSPCTSTHLAHHHEGMFIGTKVGIVEHGIGIEDANNADIVEIEALTDHLCADKNVGTTGRKVVNNALVSIPGVRSVEIHAGYPCFGKQFAHLVFHLFRAISAADELLTSTLRALHGHAVRKATIMT